jgi:hypothetical protein
MIKCCGMKLERVVLSFPPVSHHRYFKVEDAEAKLTSMLKWRQDEK